MMSSSVQYLLLLFLSVLSRLTSSAEDAQDTQKRASACYGNYRNFLDISCPPDRQVELLSMMNGAKPTNQNCPSMTTIKDNFLEECCSFKKGDCVIEIHPNNFPVECSRRHFCQPQSRLAGTGPTCNSNHFPKFTHYTEITYRCVPQSEAPSTTTAAVKATSRTSTTALTNEVAAVAPAVSYTSYLDFTDRKAKSSTAAAPATLTTSNVPLLTRRQIYVEEVIKSASFAPAMIGGMVAGTVGLMLTIFIFMFYWGRKKQVGISTSRNRSSQSSVWDFLLTNTMSVRAFRGYDNFSSQLQQYGHHHYRRHTSTSSSRHSLSSEDGAAGGGGGGGLANAVWLPNISVDSGQGESNLTSDDNCSVITVVENSIPVAEEGEVSEREGGIAYVPVREDAGTGGGSARGASSGIVLVVNRL